MLRSLLVLHLSGSALIEFSQVVLYNRLRADGYVSWLSFARTYTFKFTRGTVQHQELNWARGSPTIRWENKFTCDAIFPISCFLFVWWAVNYCFVIMQRRYRMPGGKERRQLTITRQIKDAPRWRGKKNVTGWRNADTEIHASSARWYVAHRRGTADRHFRANAAQLSSETALIRKKEKLEISWLRPVDFLSWLIADWLIECTNKQGIYCDRLKCFSGNCGKFQITLCLCFWPLLSSWQIFNSVAL